MSTTYAGDPDNFPATIPIPSGGDLVRAADAAESLKALADRTASLAKCRLVSLTVGGADDATSGHAATSTATVTGSFANVVKLADLTGLIPGDIVEIAATFWVETDATGPCYIRFGNANPFAFGVNHCIPQQLVDEWNAAAEVSMRGYHVVTTEASLSVYLQTRGDAMTLQVKKPQVVIVKVWRPL